MVSTGDIGFMFFRYLHVKPDGFNIWSDFSHAFHIWWGSEAKEWKKE
jgi:hypothetical protein